MARLEATATAAQPHVHAQQVDWQTRLLQSCHDAVDSTSHFATNISRESRIFARGIDMGTRDAMKQDLQHRPITFCSDICQSATMGLTAAAVATRFPVAAKPSAILGVAALMWPHIDPTRAENRARFTETISILRDTWNADSRTEQNNEIRAARTLGVESASILRETFGALLGTGIGVIAGSACRRLDATNSLMASLRDGGTALRLHSGPFSENTDYLLTRLPSLPAANKITNVDLSYTTLTGRGLRALSKIPNLERVSLSEYHPVACDSLYDLHSLHNLRALDLGATATDESLRIISGIKRLTELNLRHAEPMTDKGLNHLSKLTNLENLTISSANNITA